MTGHDYCVGIVAGLAVLTFAAWQWRELTWRSALRETNTAWAKMLRENIDESRRLLLSVVDKGKPCAHANPSLAGGWCNDCGERLIKPAKPAPTTIPSSGIPRQDKGRKR